MAFVYDLTDTWNAGGTTFNAIKMNVTDTASAAASKLITVQVGGAEKFGVRKDGQGYFAGNVGIGTSSPAEKLTVSSGHISLSANYDIKSPDGFAIHDTSAALDRFTFSTSNVYAARTGGNHIFNTATTERMRIDSSGRVGIGTSSPDSKLDIEAANSQLRLTDSDDSKFAEFSYSGGKLIVRNNSTTTSTEQFTLDESGRIGIGTISPSAKLDVNGPANSEYMRVGGQDGTNARGLRFSSSANVGNAGAAHTINAPDTYGQITFQTVSQDRLVIKNTGNVGIGTSSPSTKLQVSDTLIGVSTPLRVANASATGNGRGAGLEFYGASNTFGRVEGFWAGTDEQIRLFSTGSTTFSTSGSERMRITSSGNLLVGTTSAISRGAVSSRLVSVAPSGFDAAYIRQTENTSFALVSHVNTTSGTRYHIGFGDGSSWTERGTITTNGTSTSYNTSSDARLKHDIVDAPEASSLIDAIKVRSFKWNADNSEQRYGMVAQELLEVAPEAVSGDPEGEEMMGVDYSKLVPMLIKEVQQLRARVAQLEGN